MVSRQIYWSNMWINFLQNRSLKLILGLILVVVSILILKNLFVRKVGNVGPALLPPAKIKTTNVQPKTSNAPLTTPEGFVISYFSKETPGARDLQFSPGGMLLASLPKEGKVVALPDVDKDGEADETLVLVENLNKPHGLAFHDGKLFVAEETKVSRYFWDEKNLTASLDKKLFDLPSGSSHFTRSLAIKKDGTLYVSLGSSCDTCFEKNPFIAAVIIATTEGKKPEVFAKGLRNAVFIKLDSQERLWGTEMGRDFLGDNLPPDEINIIRGPSASSGQKPEPVFDYGWPVCYGKQVYDAKFGQKDLEFCKNTIPAVFDLPAHVAPLGLAFIDSPMFPDDWQGDLLVGLHGSWNSSVPVGYKVIRLKVKDSSVVSMEDFISGFIDGSNVTGRPVDVEFGADGSLFISDDKAGAIYLVTKK